MNASSQVNPELLGDRKIVLRAIVASFAKLNPQRMVKNPVMFVVEVGAVMTTLQLTRDTMRHTGAFGFGLQITLWLWFTPEQPTPLATSRIGCKAGSREPAHLGLGYLAAGAAAAANICGVVAGWFTRSASSAAVPARQPVRGKSTVTTT